jgi:hypothetical protein
VFSDPQVISLLKNEFINAWILAKDIDSTAQNSVDADFKAVCGLIKENYDYPVDSVIISAERRLAGHINVHEPEAMTPEGYLSFLKRGLKDAGRDVRGDSSSSVPQTPQSPETALQANADFSTSSPVTLTPEKPMGTVLDVIRRHGFGKMSMGFYSIDASAFADGGLLDITVEVGKQNLGGQFELCVMAPAEPKAERGEQVTNMYMQPVKSFRVATGQTKSLQYEFKEGGMFGLAAIPDANGNEGVVNAFHATITVRNHK